MNAKLTVVAATMGLVFASQARAQRSEGAQPEEKRGYFQQHVDAPTKAFEVSVGTGYTQGFGNLESGVPLSDVITPALGVDFSVGYRFDPRWSLAWVGQWQAFAAQRADTASGFTSGIAASYHLSPYSRMDPWVQLGTGYRLILETHGSGTPNLVTHGLELGKAVVGVDFRVDQDVAIAPVIGADLSLPLWQSETGGSTVAISDPRVSTFVFAGLQARFDVTSTHESGRPVMARAVSQTQITRAEVPAPKPAVEETRPVSPSLSVSDEVLKACQMDLGNIEKAPKFEFDESKLLAEDEAVLERIAECFTTGPLKGAGLRLVGRADPRGSMKYNEVLGARRADAVMDALERLGLEKTRIDATSRGELDATGTDEAGWASDRRVDILLEH